MVLPAAQEGLVRGLKLKRVSGREDRAFYLPKKEREDIYWLAAPWGEGLEEAGGSLGCRADPAGRG